MDVVQKLASVFDVSIDYLISDTDEDFKDIRIENKELMERVKLIDSLDVEDRALIRVIDSMLTKKKIINLVVTKKNFTEQITL